QPWDIDCSSIVPYFLANFTRTMIFPCLGVIKLIPVVIFVSIYLKTMFHRRPPRSPDLTPYTLENLPHQIVKA
ncbi:hypothetical protein L9F63_019303, partial [Diploptera punctata]